jgi:Bacterial regulatory proteins, gntR family
MSARRALMVPNHGLSASLWAWDDESCARQELVAARAQRAAGHLHVLQRPRGCRVGVRWRAAANAVRSHDAPESGVHCDYCASRPRPTGREGNNALVTTQRCLDLLPLCACDGPTGVGMAADHVEPFHTALSTLRERLQGAVYPPGARITAVDLADDLRLSTTPVREALSRLAGEGLVEDRRGQGYFIRQLSAADIADLYRMSLANLLIAHEPHRASRGASEAGARPVAPPPGAIEAVERLFGQWTLQTGSRALISAFRILQIQLGPVRRLEPRVLEDLDAEAQGLAAASLTAPADRLARLRQFHGRRIRVADRLAALLEAAAGPKK